MEQIESEEKRARISVVIPTKNRIADLKECISSLMNQSILINELIIVDGSDRDDIKKYIRSLKKPFKVKYIKQMKGGNAHARNIGIKFSSGDIIIFIDDDVILDKDCIRHLISVFIKDNENKIGGVGGKTEELNEDKPYKIILNLLYRIFGIIFLRDHLKGGKVTIAGHHSHLPDESGYVEWLGGTCMAYRKECLAKYNDDERLERLGTYAYYEDFDLSYRISRNYKLFLNSQAKLIHKVSPSSRLDPFKTNSIKIQNHYYLVKKHGFSRVAFWWSTLGLILAHIIMFLLKPSKTNYDALLGIIDGIKKIITHR